MVPFLHLLPCYASVAARGDRLEIIVSPGIPESPFDISWTEQSFLLIFAFVGPALYALTAAGLYYRIPFAGFLAWFIFIGPGVAEFTHFVFPLLEPH